MANLSCIKNVQFLPESASLHSLDMLPVENGMPPGLMAITLRTVDNQHLFHSTRESADGVQPWTFELRVVHGSDEIHALIRRATLKYQKNKSPPNETLFNGVWAITLRSILDSDQDYLLKLSCEILEGLVRHGWEAATSGRTTTTPGFEYVTWIFKSGNSAVLTNAEVNCLVINEMNGSLRVVPSCIQMNNVIKRALDNFLSTKVVANADLKDTASMDDSKSDSDSLKEVKKSGKSDSPLLGVRKVARAICQDDPDCPNVFRMEKLKRKSDPGKDDKIVCSNVLLEIVHLLFCRQWKMISSTRLPVRDFDKNSITECDVLFFCRDGRILPSLGQQAFTMIELEGPNIVRLYNVSDKVVADLRDVLQSENHWPEGLVSKEATRRASNCQEFRCQGSPWALKSRSARSEPDSEDKVIDRSTVSANQLIGQILLAMNKKEFNIFSTIQLGPGGVDRKNHLIFKHSSVSYCETLCVHLSGQNKLVIIGGGEQEVSTIRQTLTSRWPYPISIDKPLQLVKGSKGYQVWLFKVKRYPWAVSYGNKYLDRTIEWTRGFLRRQVPIPSPQNSDSESGKSVLVFLLKDLMSLGWRLQMSADVTSTVVNTNRNIPSKLSDPHSIFLMR